MTTTRLTPQTEKNLTELKEVREQIKALTERANLLKWLILDSRETGVQTAVAAAYDISRQSVGGWMAARDQSVVHCPDAPAGRHHFEGDACAFCEMPLDTYAPRPMRSAA